MMTRPVWLCAALLSVAACSTAPSYEYMKDGQPKAEAIVSQVAREWKAEALIQAADPRMLAAFPEPKIRDMLASCASALGAVKSQTTVIGTTGVETGIGEFARYQIDLEGENGTARITIKLQREESTWKVLGFWVELQRPSGATPSSIPSAR